MDQATIKKWKAECPLKSFRNARGLSQVNLALMLGVSVGSIAGWESGSYHPTEDNMAALARVDQATADRFASWLKRGPAGG